MVAINPVIEDAVQLNKLLEKVKPYQALLLRHPLYDRLDNITAIREFMCSHIFAVWDNMLLLKTLQQRLTCITIPWFPQSDPIAAHLINEIILDEESGEIIPGQYMSHVEFYVAAMEEIGADSESLPLLMGRLQNGDVFERALAFSTSIPDKPIAPTVQSFVLHTWQICQRQTPAVIASFLLAREVIVVPLFSHLLKQLQSLKMSSSISCSLLTIYCHLHIGIDEKRHIPMGLELLCRICGDSTQAWQQAEGAAISSLISRKKLWDALYDTLSDLR